MKVNPPDTLKPKLESLPILSSVEHLTPVAGPIFETKNRAIFLERFFGEKLLPENTFLGQ